MRQLQVVVPDENAHDVKEVLKKYSTDISSTETEKDDERHIEFTLTAESDQIDEITEKLKAIKDLHSGDLSIRVLQQESLIKKGSETKGGSSDLSQQEIYSKAQDFSGFDRADWGLVIISALVASFGVSMGNIIVVIGAMMFAPLLSPLVAASISMAVGDINLLRRSISTTLMSVILTLAGATAGAVIFSSNSELLVLFTDSTPLKILLAGLVGSAASFTSATGRQDQVAGVAVAIALVPPLAASGIHLSSLDFLPAMKAFLTAFVNMLGILVAGSLSFRYLGLKPSTYYKEIAAKRMWRWMPFATSLLMIAGYISWII